jgi:hypothetical protein
LFVLPGFARVTNEADWVGFQTGGTPCPADEAEPPELIFTLIASPGCRTSNSLDRAAVQRDLEALKALLEREAGAGCPGPLESGHAPVDGIRMYYEVYGREEGVPLVLLHGGGSTIEVTFGRVVSAFARRRRVIAVEEQGHGRTTDRDASVAFETSADDVGALLRYLKIAQADLWGSATARAWRCR